MSRERNEWEKEEEEEEDDDEEEKEEESSFLHVSFSFLLITLYTVNVDYLPN